MPTFVGFSTRFVNQPKTVEGQLTGIGFGQGTVKIAPQQGRKWRVVDQQLIQIDLLNALNIKQGSKVGQPGYGTTIWSMLYEQNTAIIRQQLEAEIRRVASGDPRLIVDRVDVYESDNGVLLQVQITIQPFNSEVSLGFFLNRATGVATAV